MSGVEVVTIIACVAGVVSAFASCSKAYEKIKAKRAAKKAPPPLRSLEDSLDQAPIEINREKDRGVARFGRLFAVGDNTAIIAIQHEVIQLQDSLVKKLSNAEAGDEDNALCRLADEADRSRNNIVRALLDLHQRLLTVELAASISIPAVVGLVHKEPQVTTMLLSAEDLDYGHTGTDVGHGNKHRRRPSLGDVLKTILPQRTSSRSNTPRSSSKSCEVPASGPRSPHNTCTNRKIVTPDFTYGEHEDNPFEIWGSSNTSEECRASRAVYDARVSGPITTIPNSQSPVQHRPTLNLPDCQRPSSENNFLGFCKGAWKLQNEDRSAIRGMKDWSSSQGYGYAQRWSVKCVDCEYKCPLDVEGFWSKVHTNATTGIKFRWLFLAKSHVQHRGPYTEYYYQCLFCAFTGQKSQSFSANQYLDHINLEHRRSSVDNAVSAKIKCINDRVCSDEEDFHINLLPFTASERSSLRVASVPSRLSNDSEANENDSGPILLPRLEQNIRRMQFPPASLVRVCMASEPL